MKTEKIIYAAVIAFLLTLVSCGQKAETATEEIKFVKIEQVSQSQQKERLLFNGKIEEKSLTTLSFRVAGPLYKLNVKVGDYITKGEVIAAIDKRDYELKLQSSKAQYEQMEGEYKRYTELHEKNKIPDNSYEKVKSGYQLAKAGYSAAVNGLNDTELKAPFSGYIHQTFVENFQTVGAGMPIVSLIDLSKLEVEIAVPENQLELVKTSRSNLLTVRNANAENLPVEILSIAEKTGKDGLFNMKFTLDTPDTLKIMPGMSAEITMLCGNSIKNNTIPTSAIFHSENRDFVWIYNKSSENISRREIQVGMIKTGGIVEVISGLNSNEYIVTAGVDYLFDNQRVQPIKKPSATNVGGLL